MAHGKARVGGAACKRVRCDAWLQVALLDARGSSGGVPWQRLPRLPGTPHRLEGDFTPLTVQYSWRVARTRSGRDLATWLRCDPDDLVYRGPRRRGRRVSCLLCLWRVTSVETRSRESGHGGASFVHRTSVPGTGDLCMCMCAEVHNWAGSGSARRVASHVLVRLLLRFTFAFWFGVARSRDATLPWAWGFWRIFRFYLFFQLDAFVSASRADAHRFHIRGAWRTCPVSRGRSVTGQAPQILLTPAHTRQACNDLGQNVRAGSPKAAGTTVEWPSGSRGE